MKPNYRLIFILLATLVSMACGFLSGTGITAPPTQQSFPTPAEPSGTIIKNDASSLVLSHPKFHWAVKLPGDWVVTYDSGYQVNANNPDQTIFMRIQAQRWKQAEERLPNAKAYVEHWKNFTYGNVFPLYANGTQISETEISQDKFGGPYLHYEFDDSNNKVQYLQVYASAGEPSSAMLSIWASYDEYDNAQNTMQTIIDSFELLEESQ